MTKEEVGRRKEEIRIEHPVVEIMNQYGVQVKQGRCKAICHDGRNYTAKVSESFYYCFKCGRGMDVFDIIMHFEHCDFWTAFELLGGTQKSSFTTRIKAAKAKRQRELTAKKLEKEETELQWIFSYITVYRTLIKSTQPFSDDWCYYMNKLQYQLYLLEVHNEKR